MATGWRVALASLLLVATTGILVSQGPWTEDPSPPPPPPAPLALRDDPPSDQPPERSGTGETSPEPHARPPRKVKKAERSAVVPGPPRIAVHHHPHPGPPTPSRYYIKTKPPPPPPPPPPIDPGKWINNWTSEAIRKRSKQRERMLRFLPPREPPPPVRFIPDEEVIRSDPQPAPFPERLLDSSPAGALGGSPHTVNDRYLFVCVNYGRHNNQLIELAKSYSLAYHTGRTLVLPRFYAKHVNDDGTQGAENYYDLSSGPVPLITSDEFEALFAPKMKEMGGKGMIWGDAVCIDYSTQCRSMTFARCKRRYSLRTDPGADPLPQLEHLRGSYSLLVTGGENTFMANVPHSPCIYRYLTLNHASPVFEEIRRYRALGADLGLPQKYMAMHMRSFENKCVKLAKQHARARAIRGATGNVFVRETLPMCSMNSSYYRSFGWNGTQGEKFFVAHDRQSSKMRYYELSSDGAVFYKPNLEAERSLLMGSTETMLVEFWLSADADVFVGNAFSTVSLNICALRRARDRSCPNLDYLLEDHPCFPHPDWMKGHKRIG